MYSTERKEISTGKKCCIRENRMSNTDECTMTLGRLNAAMLDMERSYGEWQESEQRSAYEKSIMEKLQTIPPGDLHGRAYQLLRLKYSEAYFRGHPLYCGEEWKHGVGSALSNVLLTILVDMTVLR